ncbi:hypothetical protein KCP74_25365 [Salmonella enterica subsp. enterica]|nr:hypothetical protein KCP74_25365 [Salmonella enterica subsp. enterica]
MQGRQWRRRLNWHSWPPLTILRRRPFPLLWLPQHPFGAADASPPILLTAALTGKRTNLRLRNQPRDGISLAGYPFINGVVNVHAVNFSLGGRIQ